MNEFTLIDAFFKSIPNFDKQVLLGIGDDAACLSIPKNQHVLVSTDTLVSDVHFLMQWSPYDIASRAVLVNISDMAAMAAEPRWITLALTLPTLNEEWLSSFAQGLRDTLTAYNMTLIGGDTTKGPMCISLTILGLAPFGQVSLRCGAKPGDIILVSGELGAAALAVKHLNDQKLNRYDRLTLMNKLQKPKPRVDLIPFLRQYASSAIDISDGLSADLNHICEASGFGAILRKEAIPIHPIVQAQCPKDALNLALSGGDDYELCFTVAEQKLEALMEDLKKIGIICYPIGIINERPGLRFKLADGRFEDLPPSGYSHF